MKKTMGFLMMLLMSNGIAFAAESSFACIDGDSLNEYAEIKINNATMAINETKTCSYGCSSDFKRCKPDPIVTSFLGFGLPLFSILSGFLLFRKNTIWTVPALTVLLILNAATAFLDIFNEYVRILAGAMIFLLAGAIAASLWDLKNKSDEDDD